MAARLDVSCQRAESNSGIYKQPPRHTHRDAGRIHPGWRACGMCGVRCVALCAVTFADGYRQLVIPRLERIIKLEANHVTHGIQNFMGAWCSVMHYANKWGSGALPSDVFTDL